MHLILKHLHLVDVQGAVLVREKVPVRHSSGACLSAADKQSQLKAFMRLLPVERVQKQIIGSVEVGNIVVQSCLKALPDTFVWASVSLALTNCPNSEVLNSWRGAEGICQ